MPRKNINMSESQLDQIRSYKWKYQKALDLTKLSDREYIMAIAEIVDRSLKVKRK